MLFHSSIRKELARGFGATLVALITIVMTMMLIRTLGQAAKGSVNPSEVMMVLGYTVLGYLPTILTLSLFVATVSTLSRMYSDSEMVIWFASGYGLTGLLRPLLRFAWPILLAVAAFALVVWPWANQQIQGMKDRYEQRGDLERIAPGQFQESANGNRVFFIDKDSPDKRSGNNVFISSIDHGRETVTSARSAKIDDVGNQRFLILNNGQRLESTIGQPDLKISQFQEYGTRVSSSALDNTDTTPSRARSSLDLVRDPSPINQGELAWRLSLALAALNFVVIALAVSGGNPRSGRSGNILFALFAFVVYFNLLNLGQSWIANGTVPFGGFLLGLHGGVFLLAMGWLLARHHNWSWRNLLPKPTAQDTQA
ncbi:lipopolysaccharide export system permease protein [Rhodoferax sp. OV413]|uniref:LPS export ABC transporter permease LptF n=1 Tax=Rhodoferax sp. OV413 TaxID=1855285 RepID=UPI00088ABBFC|nr:LPS export ABC transporter permease LptF [Rhodoferax sp. OV413]SDP79556.1 lipopolysaccharide export system permease protein [Rhodoferax sp. OV413]